MAWRERLGYGFVRLLIRITMTLLTRTSVIGAEHLPRTGPGIVVSNHIDAIDPAILVGVLPRPIALMSKAENNRGALRLFMPMVGAFTVRRGTADRRALHTSEQVLKSGRLLCLFPEGTRSLCLDGAELILVSAAWDNQRADEWRSFIAARAAENACFVCAANRVGEEPATTFAGESMIVGPRGQVIVDLDETTEGYIVAKIDLDETRRVREETQIFQARQPLSYRSIVRKY